MKAEMKLIPQDQEEKVIILVRREDRDIQELQYIHTKQEVYTTKLRLYVLEKELPDGFVRISKSSILNMEKVKEYKPMMGGIMRVEFPNGEMTYISRKYLRELRNKIKEGLL